MLQVSAANKGHRYRPEAIKLISPHPDYDDLFTKPFIMVGNYLNINHCPSATKRDISDKSTAVEADSWMKSIESDRKN
jgi:hypothetical protein